MNNAKLLKRGSAYLIDLIVLGAVSMIIYYFIPEPADTLKLQTTLNKLNDAILSDGIAFKDYIDGYVNIMYNLDKERIIFTVINFATIFIYFVLIPFLTKGRTLGNYIVGIKIKNNKNDKISFLGLFARNFIINGLGYLIVQILLIYLVNPNHYFYILTIFAFIQILLVIISVFMVKYRKDRRGLHDIIGGTVVINNRGDINE